ncbi:MAG: class I SAM-dependent methyltransferase, partial [Casimicrobiaceae bacterium]
QRRVCRPPIDGSMKGGQVSTTAKVVAASTILLASDSRTAALVAPGAGALCTQFLASTRGDRLLAGSARHPLARSLWRWLERCTLPGIVVHYWLRKRWIEARCRDAIGSGYSRVIVLGAGFDTLACRLAPAFPAVEFVEVDHPATQAVKRKGLAAAFPGAIANLRLAAVDFDREVVPRSLLIDSRPTLVIAEGLLMYLDAERIGRLLASVLQLSTGPVRLVFSYMVRWSDGASGFRPGSRVIDLWLAWRGEPFAWTIEPLAVGDFLRRHGFTLMAAAASGSEWCEGTLRGENLVVCDVDRTVERKPPA